MRGGGGGSAARGRCHCLGAVSTVAVGSGAFPGRGCLGVQVGVGWARRDNSHGCGWRCGAQATPLPARVRTPRSGRSPPSPPSAVPPHVVRLCGRRMGARGGGGTGWAPVVQSRHRSRSSGVQGGARWRGREVGVAPGVGGMVGFGGLATRGGGEGGGRQKACPRFNGPQRGSGPRPAPSLCGGLDLGRQGGVGGG